MIELEAAPILTVFSHECSCRIYQFHCDSQRSVRVSVWRCTRVLIMIIY